MIEGRGLHMVERSKKTRQRITKFMEDNPQALKKDLCDCLGISPVTLRKHLQAIKEG